MSEKMPSSKPEQEQPEKIERSEQENRSLGQKILGIFSRLRGKQRNEAQPAQAEETANSKAETAPILEEIAEAPQQKIAEAPQQKAAEAPQQKAAEQYTYAPESEAEIPKMMLNRNFEEYQRTLQEIAEKGDEATPEDMAKLEKIKDKITRAQIDYAGHLLPVEVMQDYLRCFYTKSQELGEPPVFDKRKSFVAPFLVKAANGTLDAEKLQAELDKEDTSDGLTKEERTEIWESVEPYAQLLLDRKKK